MTYADPDFIPVEQQEDAPNYPTVFGITFTPKVSGITIAVLGLLGAAYLAMNIVKPVFDEYNTLKTQRQEKESQRQSTEEIQKQVKQKELELVQAKQQNQKVLSLFAKEESVDTLLLDVNQLVKGTKDGTLVSYKPVEVNEGESDIVTDGSLGAAVNGKLKRQSFNLEMEGSFNEIQSILRNIERLQPLLVVKDLKTEVTTEQGILIDVDKGTVISTFVRKDDKIIPGAKPTLKASYRLDVLMPLSEEQKQEAAKAAAAEAAAQQPAQ